MSNKTQQHLKFCFLFVVFSILLSSCQYPAEKQENTDITLPTSDVGLIEPVEENYQVTEQDIESIKPGYFYFRNSEKEVALYITVTAENPNTVVADYDKFVENHHAKEISSQDDTVMYQTAFPLDDPVYYSIWFDMRSPEHSWTTGGYNFLNVILINGDTLEIVFDETGHDVLLRIEHAYGGYTLYSGQVTYYT
jgi:hypothetical protein